MAEGPKIPLKDKPGDNNWVDKAGGLPDYIKRIAEHIKGRSPKMDDGRAIASAVNTVKRWAAGGTVRERGGPKVSVETQAKAAAALAEWEAKKSGNHSAVIEGGHVRTTLVLADGDRPMDMGLFTRALIGARTQLNLAVFDFNPADHPRDPKGQFREIVGKLKVGESVKLPDGVTVSRKKNPGGKAAVAAGAKPDLLYVKSYDGGSEVPAIDPTDAQRVAFARSARNMDPASLGGATRHTRVDDALAAHKKQTKMENKADASGQPTGKGVTQADIAAHSPAKRDEAIRAKRSVTGGTEKGKSAAAQLAEGLKRERETKGYPALLQPTDPNAPLNPLDVPRDKPHQLYRGASSAPKATDDAAAIQAHLPEGFEYNGDDGAGHYELLDSEGFAYAMSKEGDTWHFAQLDMDGGIEDSWEGATPEEAFKAFSDDPAGPSPMPAAEAANRDRQAMRGVDNPPELDHLDPNATPEGAAFTNDEADTINAAFEGQHTEGEDPVWDRELKITQERFHNGGMTDMDWTLIDSLLEEDASMQESERDPQTGKVPKGTADVDYEALRKKIADIRSGKHQPPTSNASTLPAV